VTDESRLSQSVGGDVYVVAWRDATLDERRRTIRVRLVSIAMRDDRLRKGSEPTVEQMIDSISERVECLRPRLFGIAYRMLGGVHDAEDVVQEGMLRWQQADRAAVREPEAWLVSVVTRLAIDRLRRASTERELYPGPWLPEPVADERFSADRSAELASDLSMAFLVLLERLAPEERAAFLLREVFDADYEDIARTLDKTPAAARQTVHRARERIHADRARFSVATDAKDRLFQRFLAALENDDRDEMLAVIAPEATFTSDGGGKVLAARRTIQGRDLIVRMLAGIEKKYDRPFTYRIGHMNGEAVLIMYKDGLPFGVTHCETDGERILAFYRVMNPEKLGEVVSS
jgi:RNA polymerase sigma-70 factor (ECF subfamily)